jgi:hypothetical protein
VEPDSGHGVEDRAPELLAAITRDWACGDSTGVGASVCILDSGVEFGHPPVGEVHPPSARAADAVVGCAVGCGPHGMIEL